MREAEGAGGPVLAFDTSAAHCAAALVSEGRIVASGYEEMSRGQAERIMGLCEDVLTRGGCDWRALERIGVGIGPGNFTGIRISVAAARGLALGLGVPAVGVSGLEALSYGRSPPVIASIDARGGRVYLGPDAPVLADLEALPDLPHGAVCVGHAAEDIARACGGHVATPALPLAEAIAHLAAARRTPVPRPAPLYLRAPDAAPAAPVPPTAP